MKKITKIAGLLLAVSLMGSAFASGKKDGSKEVQLGTLSYLNFTEEKVGNICEGSMPIYKILQKKGYMRIDGMDDVKISPTVRFYDTLEGLLMALKSGEIWGIAGIPQSTAKYLCAKDNSLGMKIAFDTKKSRENDIFASIAYKRLSDGFSFMMLEKNSALCEQFNKIIEDMTADGSLAKLIENEIIAAMDGREIREVAPEYKPERKTIKVAVAGAIPPMDYVAADGTFAGFNTAILAEIGKRLDRNITMVQVSSIGRATALASGTVDVVFWTRSPAVDPIQKIGSEEFSAVRKSARSASSEEETAAMQILTASIIGNKDGDMRGILRTRDMPAGTVITTPYFEDLPVIVGLKK